jgi:hypothetical protein
MKTGRICEYAIQPTADVTIDEENRLISNVAILGKESRDTGGRLVRRFSDTALGEFAERAEGTHFYWNHPGEGELREYEGHRDIRNMAGVVLNVRYEDGKVRGDIQAFEDSFPRVRDLVRANAPRTGLSPELSGEWTEAEDGVHDVEHITDVYNVAVVDWPATNRNFSESAEANDAPKDKGTGGEDQMDWNKVSLEDLQEHVPHLIEAAQKELKGEVETLTADKAALEGKIRESAVAIALAEADIPEDKRTKAFTRALESAETDEERKEIIDDHKRLIETAAKSKDDPPESSEKKHEETKAPENIYGGYRVDSSKE